MLLALGSQSHNEIVITETQGNKDDSISSSRQLPVSPHFTLLFPQEKGEEGPRKAGQAGPVPP